MLTASSSSIAFARAVSPGRAAVHAKRLLDLTADVKTGIERGHRLLEDQRDLGAPDALHLAFAERPKSRPSKMMRPSATRPGGCTSRMIDSAVTDLPLPDSPTRHSVSPAYTSKLTSITAGTKRPWTARIPGLHEALVGEAARPEANGRGHQGSVGAVSPPGPYACRQLLLLGDLARDREAVHGGVHARNTRRTCRPARTTGLPNQMRRPLSP